jgi:hypothetical protein
MAARCIVAATEEGGRPFFSSISPLAIAYSGGNWTFDPAGDSGDDGAVAAALVLSGGTVFVRGRGIGGR